VTNKKIINLSELSAPELAALIDEGSEEAAKYAMELLVEHLYLGKAVPYEFRFRLSLGLKRFVAEKNCAELLNSRKGMRWVMASRKFKPPTGSVAARHSFKQPSSAKGRKKSDFDQNLLIFQAVKEAKERLGRLRDSVSGPGAFSEVAEQHSLSPDAVEKRYYKTGKSFDRVMAANAKDHERKEFAEELRPLLKDLDSTDQVRKK
jgi:hypothetical protein